MNDKGGNPRLATDGEVSTMREIVDAAYRGYLTRMDRLPASGRRFEAGLGLASTRTLA